MFTEVQFLLSTVIVRGDSRPDIKTVPQKDTTRTRINSQQEARRGRLLIESRNSFENRTKFNMQHPHTSNLVQKHALSEEQETKKLIKPSLRVS